MQRVNQVPVDHPESSPYCPGNSYGAMTFLREEYSIISLVALFVAGLLYMVLGLDMRGISVGAALSLIAGIIGMHAATRANVRTTLAARLRGNELRF